MMNPCTGELVLFEGTTHLVIHRTQDADGVFHFKGQFNLHVIGESASGAKYVAHDMSNSAHNFDDVSESPETFTITNTLKFIRQGSETAEDDFQSKLLVHITINANGEVTSLVEQSKGSECK
jgi:hypothetical protein